MNRHSRKTILLWAASVLTLSVAANAEPQGFAISIGGMPVAGDKGVAASARHADIGSSSAKVQVKADGLGARPRLDLEVVSVTDTGAQVQSRVNYPAWVAKAEVRVVNLDTGKLLTTVPILPNGRVDLTFPEGNFAATHRVYDAQGRYDETVAVSLQHARGLPVEAGVDRAARRGIPVSGGAVTVYGTGIAPGAVITTMGETLRADASGDFVLQRILPVGDHSVPVSITGSGENLRVEPFVSIPKAEWFYVATADLTLGKIISGPRKSETYSLGRLAYYANGKTAKGWDITSSADTGEAGLEDLFRQFDHKDPAGLLSRLDPSLAYPTYGDDSSLENGAPTSGKFYFRAARDGSHVLWGNYKGRVTGSEYLRNERSLYGAQGVYATPQQTANGESRTTISVYAAQPDMLPGREVFLGTGGSVYFLQRQDIAIGSETLTIELRDQVTGRVLERRSLVAGRDFTINYIQGVITLTTPLQGSGATGVVSAAPGVGAQSRLVVQYEYTPTATDIDGFAYGGRVEVWATDHLRLGVTAMVDQTDTANQTASGVDLRYTFGTDSFVEAEVAQSAGPGFGQSYSVDGGLIVGNTAALAGTGEAQRVKAQIDFADMGLSAEGRVSGYFENKTAGFSTLDHQTTVDETLWGLSVEGQVKERLGYSVSYDAFSDANGKQLNRGTTELSYEVSPRTTLELGVAHEDRVELGVARKTGARTDLAAKMTVQQSDQLAWYVFGQSTVARSGGYARNDRVGAGFDLALTDHWKASAELSDGTSGPGGKALINYANGPDSAYFGYTLDPGRELGGVTLTGTDAGQIVAGGKRKINETTTVFGENTYDLFGQHKALTQAYGVEFAASKALRFSSAIELGQIDSATDNFDRRAVSLGMAYAADGGLQAKSKLELRQDRGTVSGAVQDADTILFGLDATYKVDETQRWMMSFNLADTHTNGSSVLSGHYAKAVIGYGLRPVANDRLNVLLKYTYLDDMYGQRVDGSDQPGPRQRSHVLSVDATYDMTQKWTLGAKLGVRLGESAPTSTAAFAKNDASLMVLNARYHLTHQWDLLVEGRALNARQAGFSEMGVVGSAYRHFGQNLMLGVGYNFGQFSDDLTDLTQDDQGVLINLIAKF